MRPPPLLDLGAEVKSHDRFTERDKLGKELANILRGSSEQRAAFLDGALLILNEYRTMIAGLPPVPAKKRQPKQVIDRFKRLGAAARRLANEVRHLDNNEIAWLRSADRGEQAAAGLAWLQQAVSMELGIRRATNVIIDLHRKVRTRKQIPVLEILVRNLAMLYRVIYRKHPSPNKDGTFCKAYLGILRHANLENTIGRKKMEQILSGT